MKIREATVADKPKIAAFQIAMAHETENLKLDPPIVDMGVQAVFDDPSKGIYFVAETNDEVVGSLLITYEWSDWRNGNVWWIQSVYVIPGFRRKGVYSKMYSYIQALVNENKSLRGIRLYADKSNLVAQSAYHNLGMNSEHYSLFEWMKG